MCIDGRMIAHCGCCSSACNGVSCLEPRPRKHGVLGEGVLHISLMNTDAPEPVRPSASRRARSVAVFWIQKRLSGGPSQVVALSDK